MYNSNQQIAHTDTRLPNDETRLNSGTPVCLCCSISVPLVAYISFNIVKLLTNQSHVNAA